LEIPNFKYKICPKSKYNLHFSTTVWNFVTKFSHKILTSFYQLHATLERNRPYGNLIKAINFTPFPRRMYAECHKFLTTSTCPSIISIRMQSLIAVFQTVPGLFRKTSQLSTLITRTIFIPQHRVNGCKLTPTRANYRKNFRAVAATFPEI